MTIIVYRDGIIASDSFVQTSDCYIYGKHKKISRSAGLCTDGISEIILGGGTGLASVGSRFLRWIENHHAILDSEVPYPIPSDIDTESYFGFTVKRKYREKEFLNEEITGYDSSGYYAIETEYLAIGIGQRYAAGALEMGATAEQAVAVACKLDRRCGGMIQVLRADT